MRSTQKKQSNAPEKKGQWQIPERQQVFVTPGAQKSIEDARDKGIAPKITSDRKSDAPRKTPPAPSADFKSNTPRPAFAKQKAAQKKAPAKKRSEPLSLKDAILAELKDRLRTIRLGIQLNSEDIVRGVICGLLMILFAVLQTTFFVRFAPFGKVPDLMLVFVIAMGVYEGEKWGSVVGLAAAFLIQALGSSGNTPELLSLIYMPVGCAAGLLSKYYLRHTLPVNAVYVAAAGVLRAIITVITAALTLEASLGDIIARIAVPEYFSTLVIAPIPFVSVWLAFRSFHKTRAERTDRKSEI